MKTLPDKFRVGLVQMSATPDPDKNLQRAIDRLHQATAKGAQIVCLPELFQTQYFCQREDAVLFDLAEPIPGPTTSIRRISTGSLPAEPSRRPRAPPRQRA